jgi:uncharacterized PurR-regulated membrane protein YhhQ (DUF165 family)
MDGGDIGVLLGVATVALGALVGRRFGPKAERNFVRTVLLVAVGAVVLALVLGLIWSAIAGST